jgi:hypothetical protein
MVITVGQVIEHAHICQPVLRIHHILGRIRIRGSMPPTDGCRILLFSPLTFKMATKNYLILLMTFLSYIYIIFQRLKVKKKSLNSRNQGFAYYFCLMIEGSGSGSRRPKSIRIRWLGIRNTVANHPYYFIFHTFPLIICFL